jgi:eukaryotic-like serine/threonine-protein kinase
MLASTKTCRACGMGFSGAEVFCPTDGSRLTTQGQSDTSVDPLIATTLDERYRVLRVLGEGGMGIVYEGEHARIDRRVAIKVLRDDFCQRADVVERFRREAKSASRIGHPNIVDVIDFGTTPGGASYFVMELLHGQDLADLLAGQGALSPQRAALIVYQCCHALAATHDKNIVHRDLKPENIFLIERESVPDFVKIVDFGVAKMGDFDLEPTGEGPRQSKLTRTGMIFGTPEYMSPEQAAGLVPDLRADIYALGVTLYELLSGRVPFEGESFMSVLTKHASKPVPPLREVRPHLALSAELEAVVLRALHKDRAKRFQGMREMAEALQATPEMPLLPFRLSQPLAGRTTPSSPGVVSSPEATESSVLPVVADVTEPSRAPARRWLRRAAIPAALLALGALVYIASSQSGDARRAAATAPVPMAQQPSAAHAEARDDLRSETLAQAVSGRSTPSSSAAEPEALALDLVSVRVTTEPAGASVRLADGLEVCAKTPCAFDAVRGAEISLRARRGNRAASATLHPGEATQLHLVLDGRAQKPGAPTASRSVASAHDDLKVPAIFR